jgi:hypothetical protein
MGNSKSVFKNIGASNHGLLTRQNEDYYATDPIAARLLLQLETFSDNIWECACGEGHLSKVFEESGYNVKSTDLINRGYGKSGVDFLETSNIFWNGDIITNPPFKYAQQFVEKALEIIPEGNKVAMFLKLQFLEGKSRKKLFLTNPPKIVYVSSSRILCAKNGDFEKMRANGGTALAQGWFIWVKGYKGDTVIKWFN